MTVFVKFNYTAISAWFFKAEIDVELLKGAAAGSTLYTQSFFGKQSSRNIYEACRLMSKSLLSINSASLGLAVKVFVGGLNIYVVSVQQSVVYMRQ